MPMNVYHVRVFQPFKMTKIFKMIQVPVAPQTQQQTDILKKSVTYSDLTFGKPYMRLLTLSALTKNAPGKL